MARNANHTTYRSSSHHIKSYLLIAVGLFAALTSANEFAERRQKCEREHSHSHGHEGRSSRSKSRSRRGSRSKSRRRYITGEVEEEYVYATKRDPNRDPPLYIEDGGQRAEDAAGAGRMVPYHGIMKEGRERDPYFDGYYSGRRDGGRRQYL